MQIVLPLRVTKQPTPAVYPGGDCGPCALAGLTDLTVREVYEDLIGKIAPPHFEAMRHILLQGQITGMFDRVIVDPATFQLPLWLQSWGSAAHLSASAWFHYVLMAVDAGYYGLAMVRLDRSGVHSAGPDHWVMICGARIDAHREVLVSCPARDRPDEEWVEAGEFLRARGGYNLLLVRPTKIEEQPAPLQ